jgi:alpha-tubulin suppressor-like RCC1 family protein
MGKDTNAPYADYYSTGLVKIAGQVLTDAVAIAAGGAHGLALRSDGTVVGWGANGSGEALGFPTPYAYGTNGQVRIAGTAWSNVTAIAAGRWMGQSFSLALKGDRMVEAWGDNRFGQTAVPLGLSNVMAIAAGTYHGLALRSDGTVVGWGQGNPPPRGLSNVTAIAAGGEYGPNLALLRDGSVVDWPVRSVEYVSKVPAGLSNAVAVAAGGWFGLALRRDSTVLGWGANRTGQATGIPTKEFPHEATGAVVVAGQALSNVVAIAAGREFSLGLKSDGRVVAWGHPLGMQMNVPSCLTNVVAIAAGENFSLAITTNRAPCEVEASASRR